jgi:4-hydroxy-3-methylbut-2-en-1-yl diphosphate reductase
MTVEIDNHSGFCIGVINAITSAERELAKKETLYCLGEIVHNNAEVERLEKEGLRTITHNELKKLSEKKVLIRAHGEPPSTFGKAKEHNIRIINATCLVVLRLQKKIKESYLSIKKNKGQIVIYGKKGHPEVNGLVGQTEGEAIVIGSAKELGKIDFSRPVTLFAQTTMDKEQYADLNSIILKKMQQKLKKKIVPLEVNNTICGSVSNRMPELKKFSKNHDVIIFVSGRESSNGKVLYQACKSVNKRTHFVSDVKEIMPGWFFSEDRAGICGATSTPRWQMELAAKFIKNLY